MKIPFTNRELVFRKKAAVPTTSVTGQLQSVFARGWFRIVESFTGAWQTNTEITLDNVTTHPTVFACTTLIANDISKMRCRLVQQDVDGIWTEQEVPAFSPVLRRPNRFQNRIQFIAMWVISKLLNGNTYVLLIRDDRRVVNEMFILDPQRVRPLVAPNGDVFYELGKDPLSQLPDEMYVVPASEIIHDRHNTLFHPLVGLSPIYAAGLAAVQGLNIMNSSTVFFQNGGNPGAVIEVPGAIEQPAADRIKAYWDTGFSGDNSGKVAVLGDGMKLVQMKMSAVDAEVIKTLNWSDEKVCSAYHVPPYMAGVGPMPTYNNIEALATQYYTQCLQHPIESIELCLDEGLGLTVGSNLTNRYGTEFDLDDLFRMDSATLLASLEKGKNYFTPNEGRKRINLKPVKGGDTVYRQQQDFSLEALSKRDAKADPFEKKPTTVSSAAALPSAPAEGLEKSLALRYRAFAIANEEIAEQWPGECAA